MKVHKQFKIRETKNHNTVKTWNHDTIKCNEIKYEIKK